MDFVWNLIDQVQKSAAFLVIQKLAVIDWVVIFFVLFGMLQGSKKGCVEMLAKAFEMTLIIVLTLTFYPMVSKYLVSIIPALTTKMADPVVFIPCATFIWLSVSWSFNLLGKVFRVDVSPFLRFLGGVLFGGLYCALLLSLLVQIVLFLPGEAVQRPFTPRGSYTGQWIAKLAPSVQNFAISPFTKRHKPAQ
ncbi:MAG TPA: CvpA family protein [Candidatus Omnitrophota bacterium]|nr:CvpA family protein [Candidatus Omnitrophota bacterium]HQB94977.1 CvpA family protein [Candidatus Omnitrophota bacterium]